MDDNFEEDPFAGTNAEGSSSAFGFEDDFAEDNNLTNGEAFENVPVQQRGELPLPSKKQSQALSMENNDEDYKKNDDFETSDVTSASSTNGFRGDPLLAFNKEWSDKLAETDAFHAQQRQRIKDSAKAEMAKFVEERASIVETKQKNNRVQEEDYTARLKDTEQSNNPWEKVSTLIDVSAESLGVLRFRNLLLQLKSAHGEVLHTTAE